MLKKFAAWIDASPILGISLAFALIVSASVGVWFYKRHVDEIPAVDVAVREVPTFQVTREKLRDRLPNALEELANLPPIPEPTESDLPPLDIDIETLQPDRISPSVPVTPQPSAEKRPVRKVATKKQKPLLVRDCEAIFGPEAQVCKVD